MFAFMLTSQFKTKNSDYIGKATNKLDSRPEDSKVDTGNEKKQHRYGDTNETPRSKVFSLPDAHYTGLKDNLYR